MKPIAAVPDGGIDKEVIAESIKATLPDLGGTARAAEATRAMCKFLRQ